MLMRISVAGAAAASFLLVACSSEYRPPELGDCTPMGDASCSTSSIGSGSIGGGSDDASAVCNAGPAASQCDVCANAKCCMPLTACAGSTQCNNLLSCVMGCGGAAACVDGCNHNYSGSVTTLDAIDSCLMQKCVVCSESGIGDPCASGANTCVAGLTCNGAWCTRVCAQSSDCAGIGPNAGNFTSAPNACISTPSGGFCAPGCATNADCADFPGTFCLSTTSFDRLAVSICSSLPDGG